MNPTLITALAGCTAAALAATVGASPASAAGTKSPLMGPDANLTSGTNWSEKGETVNQRGPGTVKLTVKKDKIRAEVTLRGAVPNTNYQVIVAQNSEDCRRIDALVRTDKQGRAKVTVTEPRRWWVVTVNVVQGSWKSGPRWRGEPWVSPANIPPPLVPPGPLPSPSPTPPVPSPTPDPPYPSPSPS